MSKSTAEIRQAFLDFFHSNLYDGFYWLSNDPEPDPEL